METVYIVYNLGMVHPVEKMLKVAYCVKNLQIYSCENIANSGGMLALVPVMLICTEILFQEN